MNGMGPALTARLPRGPWLASIALGVAVGVSLVGLSLSVGMTHRECTQGAVLGWSGPLAAPIALGVPPPGGLVTWSYAFHTPSGAFASSGFSSSNNSTLAAYLLLNWTAVRQTSVEVPGWGQSADCPSLHLLTPSSDGSSCFGCQLAPGVPGGVGEKTIIPLTSRWGSNPTPDLNGSYPASPLGTFSWNITGGTIYLNFGDLSGFAGNASAYPAYPGGPYAGMALSLVATEVGFGIPIHLLNGSNVTVASGSPQWMGGSTLGIHLTYIFPGAGDNRTWAMFAAGAGSAYPLGGYLFEQLS